MTLGYRTSALQRSYRVMNSPMLVKESHQPQIEPAEAVVLHRVHYRFNKLCL